MVDKISSFDSIEANSTLDVSELDCPLQLLRVKRTISLLYTGEILKIIGGNSLIQQDIIGWCERVGHIYLGQKEELGKTSLFIKKG